MPVGGVSRGRGAERPSPNSLGLDGACSRLGADGSVLGGGVRRRMGGAVASEAEKLIRKHIFIIHNLKSNNNFTEKTA